MKKTMMLSLTAMAFASLLGAQADMEQKPADMSKPEGGFSKSIAGKWDCGDFGKMTLSDNNGKVTGTYTYKKGSVTGTVKNNVFSGTWKQAKGGSGSFEFKVSIERMTPKPTNLRGKWKNKGETNWQNSPWECRKK